MESEDIAFNKIFKDVLKDWQTITKESFISLLERIKLMFPVVKPSRPEKVYYQALKELVIYHEDRARYFSIKKDSKCYKYHEMMHIFRNWSAHNKFPNGELSAEEFIILWCIFLRVYFYFDENGTSIDESPYFYERISCKPFSEGTTICKEDYLKILLQNDIPHRASANDKSVKIKKENLDNIKGISDVIRDQIGYSNNTTISIIDILLLFFREFDDPQGNKNPVPTVKCKLNLPENTSDKISFSYSFEQKKDFKIIFNYPSFTYSGIDQFFYECVSYLLLKYLNDENS